MKPISSLSLLRKGQCIFVIAVSVMLAGCQTMQTQSSMEARYVEAADPCRSMRSRLIGTQDHFSTNIGSGILIGAMAGLMTGLLSGDRDKAVKYAIIGGLTGAAGGYLKGKLEQAKSREELRHAINSDVQRDTQKITEMGSILRNLNECRKNQVAVVKRNFDDGSATAPETKVVLQNVRVSVQGDNDLIEEILGEVTERKGVYVASISQVEKKAKEVVLAEAANIRELDLTSRKARDEYQSAALLRQIEELEELTLV